MAGIIEASQLPDQEKVYLKKDWMGWRVVEPWKCPETGKINWFNLITGGKRALILTLLLFGVAIILYLGITELVVIYKDIAMNPCLYCGKEVILGKGESVKFIIQNIT